MILGFIADKDSGGNADLNVRGLPERVALCAYLRI